MRILSLALAASALSAVIPVPLHAQRNDGVVDCGTNLCNATVLRPIAEKLVARKPVRILVIGDSHTAGDMYTDGLRQRLVADYGSSGRGIVTGGRPYRGYLTWGINALQSQGWSINGYFGNIWREGGPAVGLSGYTKTANSAGESLSLTAEAPEYTFDTFILCGTAQPGGGTVSVKMGALDTTVSFNAPVKRAICQRFTAERRVEFVSVTTLDAGAVSITSMGTFRSTGSGISISNLGVPSSQLVHFARTDSDTLIRELEAYQPDMIVLAYGTNEGFNADLDLATYEQQLRDTIFRLKMMTTANVPMMLLGPPNAMTRNAAIAHAGPLPPVTCDTGIMVPGNIAGVRAIQRRVANVMGLAFWDWGRAMGGPCAMWQWRAEGLTAADAVHINRPGGIRLGAILASDFENALATAMTFKPGMGSASDRAAPPPSVITIP